MIDKLRLRVAGKTAENVLRDDNVMALPVNPFEIAAKRDIVVQAKPDAASGVSGLLLRHGDSFGILYATHLRNEGFERFSVGHELGHYFLDGHVDHILPSDGVHTSRAGFVSPNLYELEADHLAASLLMPSDLFRKGLRKQTLGLSAIEAMAEICRTSLTSTAIRYAELTDDPVAVIISTGQIVDYCFLSREMMNLEELEWLRKSAKLPKASATAIMNSQPDRVIRGERSDGETDLLDWLGGKHSIRVTEEVIGLGQYGKTLTVLSTETVEDEDEEEEGLLDSWTPRFRR